MLITINIRIKRNNNGKMKFYSNSFSTISDFLGGAIMDLIHVLGLIKLDIYIIHINIFYINSEEVKSKNLKYWLVVSCVLFGCWIICRTTWLL